MAISTQDIKKGLDITGLTSLNASQIQQITDTATPGDDRGMVVESTDSALDTPIVPNGNTTAKFKRYLWKRRSFGDASRAKLYFWNEQAISDPTLLRWIEVTSSVSDAIAIAQEALDTAEEAEALANTANSNAATAQSQASDALSVANLANATLEDLAAIVNTIQQLISVGLWNVGDIRQSAATVTYSKTVNEGWLPCDGSLVSRTIFSNLYNNIGDIFGAGDGINTFQLPDCRGRGLVAAGTGADPVLTARTLAEKIGVEEVQLTADQIAKHTHLLAAAENQDTNALTDANQVAYSGGTTTDEYVLQGSALASSIGKSGESGGDESHTNIPPGLVVNFYIKT